MKRKASMRSKARAILTNYHALKERRYLGDMSASDALIDFERAVGMAKLTQRQAEALSLVYGEDLTQKKAAEIMGVDFTNVSHAIREAANNIDDVYEMWAWKSGELSVNDFIETEESAV